MMEKTTVGSPFFGGFPSDRIPKATKDVNVQFLLPVAIPVIYTSKFLQIIPANSGKIVKLLLILVAANYLHNTGILYEL